MIPVPGHPFGGALDYGITLVYDADGLDTNAWVDAGSPTGIHNVTIYVLSTFVLRSSNTSTPALDLRGFDDGCYFFLLNQGDILGRGGDGGPSFYQDSGGGKISAGAAGGSGNGQGTCDFPSTIPLSCGPDGTDYAPGAADVSRAYETNGNVIGFQSGADGYDAGHAILMGDSTIRIDNGAGKIWGGGGGGAGWWFVLANNRDDLNDEGGAAGQDGPDHTTVGTSSTVTNYGGAGGYALQHPGAASIEWLSGQNSPEREGLIGI
jgi:hypothetical protein